jgi:putative FmdB family regulatory protein
MPIFEYVCRDCGRAFEALVSPDRPAVCPACASRQLEKQLSVFAVSAAPGRSGSAREAAPCGACGDPRGPGACSLD